MLVKRQLIQLNKLNLINRSIAINNTKFINLNFKKTFSTNNSVILNELKDKTTPIATPVVTPIVKQQKKKTGFFKWTWRILLTSVIGSSAYLFYLIYDESNPGPQIPQSELKPNGNKRKTLVILGSGWGGITTLKHLDTSQYNVILISPRNYFLFTPLLPSVPTGTVDAKSIIDPVRTVARQTPGEVEYLEAVATDINPETKTIVVQHKSHRLAIGDAFIDQSEDITTEVKYDYLVYSVGAKVNTFNIPGIQEHASFLKESYDAVAVRQKIFNAIEASRLLPKDSPERKRLLSVVVCGGGPTGVELAAEIKDYIDQDLAKFIPGIEKEMSVSLIEALPNVLNMFHPKLIAYTKSVFDTQHVDLRTNTMVKKVDATTVYAGVKDPKTNTVQDVEIPYGTLVWAGGNAQREITKTLASKILEQKLARRGLLIDDYLKLDGDDSIYAIGDCTFTKNAPTAQVAHQEGIFLADYFNKLSKIDDLQYELSKPEITEDNKSKLEARLNRVKAHIRPFHYQHQGALAYIGSERAVADLSWGTWSTVATGGSLTFLFWRSAYVSMILGIRNKVLVCTDWIKIAIFGRDCSKD
ncbi:hypothetical protein B5S28_g3402 [[Candida] boidinii]|nr:hypothetical protein B5S28_g3402 [[Candida] boidinii]OWB64027.1 hypothetical protein B5S29_g5056 [[Candida] boidinii]OWB75155.1 hypothetical protein B5S31_g5016 [[Candida] boidinii]OWB80837.1 hypothetical protein B5S32_g5146 [[Candida] boidinii]